MANEFNYSITVDGTKTLNSSEYYTSTHDGYSILMERLLLVLKPYANSGNRLSGYIFESTRVNDDYDMEPMFILKDGQFVSAASHGLDAEKDPFICKINNWIKPAKDLVYTDDEINNIFKDLFGE